jgi:starch synthase
MPELSHSTPQTGRTTSDHPAARGPLDGSAKITGVIGSGMIGTDPYDPQSWSGSSRYFFLECAAQRILHRAFGVELSPLSRLPYLLRNFAVDRQLWRHRLYLDTDYYDALSRAIALRISPTDLNGTLLQIGGIFHLRPWLMKAASVCSYHDGNIAQARQSPYFPSGISNSQIARAMDYERRVYDSVDRIFTMSHYLRASFINDFGVPESKVTVIGAGVNVDSVPELAPRDFGARRILFVGVDFQRKGGADVLQAFRTVHRAHPDARLHIVGPSTIDVPTDLRAVVTVHGFINKGEPEGRIRMDTLLREASLFVMPSLYEPFGIAPLEAMLYGVPCVLSNAWAFPEMVAPGVHGELVPPGNANYLADTLIRLLDAPDELERMGIAGREQVIREYTWPVVVRNLRASLTQVA